LNNASLIHQSTIAMHFISRFFDSNSGQPKRNIRKQTFKIESLEGREVPAVLFYGGNVLPAVETQAVYLGNGWNSQADKSRWMLFLQTLPIAVTWTR